MPEVSAECEGSECTCSEKCLHVVTQPKLHSLKGAISLGRELFFPREGVVFSSGGKNPRHVWQLEKPPGRIPPFGKHFLQWHSIG